MWKFNFGKKKKKILDVILKTTVDKILRFFVHAKFNFWTVYCKNNTLNGRFVFSHPEGSGFHASIPPTAKLNPREIENFRRPRS